MGRIIDPGCSIGSLKRITVGVLIIFLISAVLRLLVGAYQFNWEVSNSSPSLVLLSVLLVKYSISIIAILVAFFGICVSKADFLIPILIIRAIIFLEDVTDLVWFTLKKRAIVPTSLQFFYTENYLTELLIGNVLLAITLYFFIIIYNYYCELKKANSKNNNSPT